jgi:hypothetical protein
MRSQPLVQFLRIGFRVQSACWVIGVDRVSYHYKSVKTALFRLREKFD